MMLLSFAYWISLSGCAQIGSPIGGPRDTIAPVLLNASPPNHSLNFDNKRIVLTFNEYVHLQNPQNILVSPLPKKNPFIDFKLKTVTVKLYDTLRPGTTYSIQFGDAIQDINENNPVTDFKYVFSTGNFIDSLFLKGNVLLAETGTYDSTLVAMLYRDLSDSAVYKEKPDYIARVNKEGNFSFSNLPAGTYKLYALKDESGLYKYNNELQLFAFKNNVIQLPDAENELQQLYAYSQEKPEPKKSTAKVEPTLKFSTSIKNGLQDLLSPVTISFNHPLEKFDSSRIFLTDTLKNKIANVRTTIDSTAQIITLAHDWEGSMPLELVVLDSAAIDSAGKSFAKSDTIRFKIKNESDYGSIKLTFTNLDKFSNPVLQLIGDNGQMESYTLTTNIFEKKLVNPGTYTIQILEDKNQNGVWDPGNFQEKKQPEIVHRIPQTISVRANWDNERNVVL